MSLVCTPGSNGKYIIKVPVELLAPPTAGLGSPDRIAFVVVTVKPGDGSYGTSAACDVSPGDRYAAEGGLITMVNEYEIQPAPGVTRTTTTSEGVVYDPSTSSRLRSMATLGADSNVACDLDENYLIGHCIKPGKGIPSPTVCLCRMVGLFVGIRASPPPAEPFPLEPHPWHPPPYKVSQREGLLWRQASPDTDSA